VRPTVTAHHDHAISTTGPETSTDDGTDTNFVVTGTVNKSRPAVRKINALTVHRKTNEFQFVHNTVTVLLLTLTSPADASRPLPVDAWLPVKINP
jgi:hypothetical protein